MTRSKIEWCDHTWNPITGCRYGCEYCYASAMADRLGGDVRLNKMAKADYSLCDANDSGDKLYVLDKPMLNETGKILVYPFGYEPTFHRYRLDKPTKLKMGNNVFVGATADMFGNWVPDSWLDEVFKVCAENPIHNYLFLTKNPERYIQYKIPTEQENLWYGTTITGEADVDRIASLIIDANTYVSMEPLRRQIPKDEMEAICRITDWIIIGAETGKKRNKVVPELEWIEQIVLAADAEGVPVFMRDSLIPIVGEKNMRRDLPEQLQHSEVSSKLKRKLYDECSGCKAHLKKSEMITLFARSKRGEYPKQFGFQCKECFSKFCKSLGLDIPELAEFADSVTIGPGDD